MPAQKPQWFFQPRSHRNGAGTGDGDTAAGLTTSPAAMLRRHGAHVLDPERAATVHGFQPPRSTVYRARTLLVSDGVLQDTPKVGAINHVLAGVGMRLIPPPPAAPPRLRDAELARKLAQLPRVAILAPDPDSVIPVVVDAWVAVQALRAAVTPPGHGKPADSPLDQTDIEQIALEHLLVGSAIDGNPIGHSGGGLTGGTNSGGGVTGPGSTDSYVYSGGDTRSPVALLLDPPHRRSAAECQDDYGRRPVVAVLDTGVRAHPWLDVERTSAGYNLNPAGNGDGFMSVDLGIQKAILDEGKKAEAKGDKPRQLIKHPWDTPITADPLVGELDSDSGHCTFISGIVRQIAPDARVLAVRIMHSDGAVYEGDLLCALRHLVIRIAHAQAGHPEQMVDVLSLSLGYFDETPHDEKFTSGLRDVIELLLGQGVIVVAAAGNYSTSRRFYPAAFATKTPPAGVPLISVGALNPNGSKAIFSDGGDWITAWASGAAVVSTLPVDINASRSPELRLRAHPDNPMPPGISLPASRESLDPDDYSGAFAVWSGTSFSAPLLAARITRALMEGARRDGLKLTPCGPQDTQNRALSALKSMNWPG
jgi:Subtilase family